ncbi:hypothetical protein GYB59_15305 [bacterium]|nr:hypothetical protein [bacterium]
MALDEQIQNAAAKAKRLKSGDEERESHSLKEMIEADKYLEGKEAVTGNGRKICINKLRPPGSV